MPEPALLRAPFPRIVPSPSRRLCLHWLGAAAVAVPAGEACALTPRTLSFPRDFGAHPELRTEWWYITGHGLAGTRELGFQLTFFRTRVDSTQGMRSRFAARQLIFAHAAVTDLAGGRLLHDQRIAREGFGLAEATTQDTGLRLDDWTLVRSGSIQDSRYSAHLAAREFTLDLRFDATQPLLLQGVQGLSRKGPQPSQASYYYSRPQLKTRGRIHLGKKALEIEGTAWLDHEWSEELLHPEARGWDWIGMNLDDGSALTAFQLRRADGSSVWAGGSFRAPGKEPRNFAADEVRFTPVRHWTSALTQARYPVQWQVNTPAGRFEVRARLDAQELDSRPSTGAVYWEGLSSLHDAQGRRVGQGYLEMTGYAAPLRLS